ncbi:MAG: Kelch repeat-containing protein, partial [Planctomycetota bacterium]
MNKRIMFLAAVAYVVLVTGSVFASEIIHTTAQLSEARDCIGATTVGNLAIFAGGRTSTGQSSKVDIYDSSTDTWYTHELSQARCYTAATTVGSKAFFGGGFSNGAP